MSCMLALKRLGHTTKWKPKEDGYLGELVNKWITYEPIHSYCFDYIVILIKII